jgi:hypothetical protein
LPEPPSIVILKARKSNPKRQIIPKNLNPII